MCVVQIIDKIWLHFDGENFPHFQLDFLFFNLDFPNNFFPFQTVLFEQCGRSTSASGIAK